MSTEKVATGGTHASDGFLIVDVRNMCDFITQRIMCSRCDGPVKCCVDLATGQGFANDIISYCEVCDSKDVLFVTSNRSQNTSVIKGKKTPFESNIRMVAFIRAMGKGHRGLETFSKFLNTPQPMTKNNYTKLFKLHHAAAKAVATNSMTAASAEVREKYGRDCGVSVDGTWQRRGHASHHRVVSAISIDTGKCVDAEVLSNICKGCQTWEKKDKSSDAYARWALDHKCSANHTGSAGAMEAVGAVRIFTRSEELRQLRYVKYLGDGDSSSFKKVSTSQPYDDIEVEKLECIGHVQKRVGTRLRKLRQQYKGQKLKDNKGISGAGRLTEQRIDTLQNYFGCAIRQNCGDLLTMQQSVLASLYHVASTDANPNHHMCPVTDNAWCTYSVAPENFKHKHGLPETTVQLIEPIYDELSSASLLSKCLHGKTQNNNECLNKLIWDRCSKEVFVGRLTVEEAVYSAIGQFNDGNASILRLLELLGLKPGHFSTAHAERTDKVRLCKAERKSSAQTKKRRKVLRGKKKGFQDKKEQEEGNTYESGAHV